MEQPESESQIVLDDEEEDSDGLREPNATFLTDLNLLIVLLSLSSIRNEDRLNLVGDTEKKGIRKDHEANKGKTCVPSLHARKRENNDVKLMRRQTQKGSQPTPKDFR